MEIRLHAFFIHHWKELCDQLYATFTIIPPKKKAGVGVPQNEYGRNMENENFTSAASKTVNFT
jgi:hypothetical protein